MPAFEMPGRNEGRAMAGGIPGRPGRQVAARLEQPDGPPPLVSNPAARSKAACTASNVNL
jgi:hypothetical protein